MIQHTMQTPPQDEGPLDAASQSLGEAFATGFAILRYAMIAMATAFLFSGWSNISEGEVAVRCRFGKLLGEPGRQVLKPGGPYFAWPMPIDEVIRVPTTVQRLSLDESFWFEVPPEQRGRKLDELTLQRAGLVPGKDGSLITGDQNIVHAKWTVMYQVQPENAAAFVRNITTAAKAERVVRCAAEQAIVQITARTAADEFIRGQIDRAAARRAIQQVLNRLDAGITITEVLLNHPTPPLAVRQAFLEVSQAESEKAQKIEAAEREWSKVHNEAAGPGHRALNLAIDAYEQYRRQGDPAAVELVEQAIDRLLDGGRADE